MTASHLVAALSRDMLDLPTVPRVEFEWDDMEREWMAWYSGCDHTGPFGYGQSRESALADLENNFGGGEEWTR